MSSRLSVGGGTTAAVAANDTTARRVLRGWSATKLRAAACAAAMRVGETSAARMLPEASIARITVSYWYGSVTTAAGLAMAISIEISASRKIRGGRWRRNLREAPMASCTMLRLA